jgi:signal transduction histidine kinase
MSSAAVKMLKEKQALLPKNSPVPNRRILVVDDEPEIGQAVALFLRPTAKSGKVTPLRRSSRSAKPAEPVAASAPGAPEFDVTVVTTPKEAIAAVQTALAEGHPYAMGFFDVKLGADIDGIELVRQLFLLDNKMCAVFVTAYQDRSVDTIAGVLGEETREKWDYMNKPFNEGEILQKARNTTALWDLHRLKEWQEERLSEANRLLMFNERQNTVAAVGRSVAHEFGNLLTHIVGNAELALEQGKPERMKSALELILKTSDTATNILRRFRRLNDEESALATPETFELTHVLEEAIELMEFQFRKHNVQMKKHISGSPFLRGDRHSFVQVFVNLFINAMHAMPKGGSVEVTIQTDSKQHEIRIRDTGAGIKEELLEKIFEPMFTTKGKNGTGLGLSICKEIIEIDHGGRMIAQNHPQGGAEIVITVPCEEESI